MYRDDEADVARHRRRRALTLSPSWISTGYVATEFEPVLDAFAQNFDERGEVGAAVSVYLDGQPVVDLWGGLADATTGTSWNEDTLVLVVLGDEGRAPRSARTS